MSRKKAQSKAKDDFDKYSYYINSVQSPDTDVEFFEETYKDLRKKKPEVLREDFCGTHKISCEWVKRNKKYKAFGVDLDPEPIEYGKENYQSELKESERNRIEIFQANVLDKDLPKADIIDASNFSYFIFKDRKSLLKYFKSVRKKLKKDGIFIIDVFGGSKCHEANEEETDHGEYSYFWDQASFDPITNFTEFHIHFKRKGEKKREKVFSYDWRMWSIPELRDILEDAGFKKTHVYWEGTEEDSEEGNGIFTRTEVGEECEAWVAYIVSEV